jgi:macrolide transport system ATP-binding/permease protein
VLLTVFVVSGGVFLLLSCRNLKKSFGDRLVLNGVNLDIRRGDRIGLVGRNGTGKTTLANILTCNLDYDEGSIITPRRKVNIGYLRQAETHPELLINVLNNPAEVSGEFQRLASHLGISRIEEWSEERLENLSGGEKTKMALARVWAAHPDLVILDEPTNHLDYQGVDYLISELAHYQGTAIIISHDRYFLDRVVSQIAELENGTVRLYPGNYSAYREARQKERENQQHAFESQQKEQKKIEDAIAQLKTWSDKAHRESRQKAQGQMGGKEYFRKKAKKRDQAVKSQLKRLEKMRQDGVKRPQKEQQVNFNLSTREKGGRRLLEAADVSKSFDKLILFEDSSFYVNRGEKVGIWGPNGCGKTTLLQAILGQEGLDNGEVFLSESARIAYVSQELPQGENNSLKDLVKERTIPEQKLIFQLLVNLGVPYDRLQIPLGDLSRGERMKIALGLAIMGDYDLLMLDEPTNHLDIFSREAFEESLVQFPGAIILVTHDQYLMKEVCDRLLVFEDHKVRRIEDSLEGYLAKKQSALSHADLDNTNREENRLLLEAQISRVLSELSLRKPGEENYALLDQKYRELLRRRKDLG